MHICIRDFRHGRKLEEDDEQSDKASDAQIHPLDVLEPLLGVHGLSEEDSGCEKWCDERSDTLNALSDIQTDLGVTWRATDGEEVICTSFKRAETGSDHEHGATEAAEGGLNTRRPEEETAYGEDGEAYVSMSIAHS